MENKFIPQAIEIVSQAITEDNNKNYKEAFHLYKKALDHFIIGVKCECPFFLFPAMLAERGETHSALTGFYMDMVRR